MADPRKRKPAQRNATDGNRLMDRLSEESASPIGAELATVKSARDRLKAATFPRPRETRIMTVANQKGGVGKTTTTVNIAASLAKHGLNVLVIDADPQGNASTALGVPHGEGTPSTYDVLVDNVSLADVMVPSSHWTNLKVVPATIDLSGAEIEMVSLDERESRLKSSINTYIDETGSNGGWIPDYVFIDCPPSLGLLTLNAMVAASEIFIPIQTEYYALEGLSQLLRNIDLVSQSLNPGLEVSTILLTMFDKRTNLSNEVAQEVRTYFPDSTLNTKIPRSVRISEAPSFEETVISYDPSATGAVAYEQAALEIAKRGEK